MIFGSLMHVVRGIVKIRGATDGTLIGNTRDKIRVSFQDEETFVVSAVDQAIGNNKSMISLVNDTGSGKVIRVREIKIINTQNSSVTGINAIFQFKRITGHSVGTSLTPYAYDTSDSLHANVTSRTGATVSGEGVTLQEYKWSSDDWSAGPADTESADHALQNLMPVYTVQPYCKPITLRENEGLSIKQTVNSTAGTFTIIVTFTEESS